jgi:hypothetical protein
MGEHSEPDAGWLGTLDGKVTVVNGTPGLGQDREHDMGGLASLPGLEAVCEQLAERIAVLRAEQARRRAGAAVTRPVWKNLVFTGGPGSGKTRAARAVTRIYTELGLLAFGHLREITGACQIFCVSWGSRCPFVTLLRVVSGVRVRRGRGRGT